jgi:hypothetical protein
MICGQHKVGSEEQADNSGLYPAPGLIAFPSLGPLHLLTKSCSDGVNTGFIATLTKVLP